jgi:hypothetical protein
MHLFDSWRPVSIFAVFLFLIIAAAFAKMHIDVIDRAYLFDEIVLHGQVVRHAAPAPYQYRVLQPLLIDPVIKEIPKPWYRKSFVFFYSLIRFASLATALICLFFVLRRLFSHWTAFGGTLLLSAFIPFTFHNYYFQPSTIMEYAVFAVALLATVERKILWLYPLVLIGSLNRETTLFVPLIYVLWHFPTLRLRDYVKLLPLLVIWGVVFFGLRLSIPASTNLLDIGAYVRLNLTSFYEDLDVLPFLTICLLPLVRLRGMPGEYRRLLLFNVVWFPLHILASQWWEVRYYIPSIMVSLPAILWVLESLARDPVSDPHAA